MSFDRNGGAQTTATAAALFALSVASASTASDADPSDPDYDVAPGCPSRAAFGEALRARLPATLRAYALANDLAVSIRRVPADGSGPHRYRGELALAALAGAGRSVQGTSCAEVLEALTLIAALSVEQLASEPRDENGAGDARGLSGASAPDNGPDHPTGAENRSATSRRGEAGKPSFGPIAFLWWQNVSAPRGSPGVGLGVVASWAEHPLVPWLMGGAYFSGAELERSSSGPSARFEHISSYWVACAWRLPQSGPIALRPCVDVDVGALSGEGLQVGRARRSTSLWLSVGLEARASITLADRFELGAQLGGVIPLWRPRFYFLPGVTAFEVDPIGFRGGAFASVLF